MRDRFVGDVGDFGKYGLLRALCGEDLRLGVVWYYVRDRMTDYIGQPQRFQDCDPRLFEALRQLVGNCQRSLAAVEASEIFPRETVFFGEPVPTHVEKRRAWAGRASIETECCRLIFLDPDNGLKSGSIPNSGVSAKYVYHSELKPFVGRGQSLVVYHSLGMQQPHEQQVQAVAAKLRKELRIEGALWALLWHPYLSRVYFIVPNLRDRGVLEKRIAGFLGRDWGQSRSKREKPHFERVL